MPIYKIPPANVPGLLHRLAKINAKAAKLNVPLVKIAVGETIRIRDEETEKLHVLVLVTVEGVAPKLAGWQFVAVLMHDGGGTIIRAVPGLDVDMKPFRTATPICDHCKTVRTRHETFVVRNDEGLLRQVGRNCLSDFLGGKDPQAFAAGAEIVLAAGEICDESMGGGGGGGGFDYRSLEAFLATTVAVIREYGWLSRTNAMEQGGWSTADRVLGQLFGRPQREVAVTEADKTTATRLLEVARAKLSVPGADLSDYEHNLRVICDNDYVIHKTAGLAASLVGFAQRLEVAELERKLAATGVRKHVGVVGERVNLLLTLVSTFSVETDYGVSTYCNFRDAEGNRVFWKASGVPSVAVEDPEDISLPYLKHGERYEVVATVKAHSHDRRDQTIPETRLTRAVIGRLGRLERCAARLKADKAEKARAKKEAKLAAKKESSKHDDKTLA